MARYKTSSWINQKKGTWNYGDGVSYDDMKQAYHSGDFSKVNNYLTQHKDLADYLNKQYESRGGHTFTPAEPIKGTPGYNINVGQNKVTLSTPNGQTTDITNSKNVSQLINQGNTGAATPTETNIPIGTLDTNPLNTAAFNVSRVNNLTGANERTTYGSPVSYNRSQTRDIMRQAYLNPYDYSGSERNAFRHSISNDEGDWSKATRIMHDARVNNKIASSLVGTKYEGLVNPSLNFNPNLNFKFQQGGSMDNQVMEAFKQWVAQKIQNGEIQESDLKDQNKLKQLFQIFTKEQQGVQTAMNGAKLNYINQLNGRCPQGTHLSYYRVGGTLCKKCEADAHNENPDPIKAFKQKCGGKVKKKEIGGEIADDKDSKAKLVKKQKQVIKKPQQQPKPKPSNNNNDNKTNRPGPKDLKTLPGGKYPSYWTPDQRGQWDRDHDEGV